MSLDGTRTCSTLTERFPCGQRFLLVLISSAGDLRAFAIDVSAKDLALIVQLEALTFETSDGLLRIRYLLLKHFRLATQFVHVVEQSKVLVFH